MLISTADICALHRTDARTYTCMHTRAGTYARAHAFQGRVVCGDLPAINGLVHIIDALLIPPTNRGHAHT